MLSFVVVNSLNSDGLALNQEGGEGWQTVEENKEIVQYFSVSNKIFLSFAHFRSLP